jgi:uncharacterized protein YbcI
MLTATPADSNRPVHADAVNCTPWSALNTSGWRGSMPPPTSPSKRAHLTCSTDVSPYRENKRLVVPRLLSGYHNPQNRLGTQEIRVVSRRLGALCGRLSDTWITSEAYMKSQGEIEAAICEGITHFEQEYMARGPKEIRTYLLGDLLVVRLNGVLTVAEQQLVNSQPPEKGRDLLKQVRTHLMETARPVMEAMIKEITGVKVLSLHHDISTQTGEEVVLFTLSEAPLFREAKKK